MSAYNSLNQQAAMPRQRDLPGILATYPVAVATVELKANGTALLLFNGAGVGVYSSEQQANEGKALFRRMGLCE